MAGEVNKLMLHQAKRQMLLRKDTDFRVLTYTMTHMPYAVLLENVWSKELREGSAEILYCHFISKELRGGRKLPRTANLQLHQQKQAFKFGLCVFLCIL